jgi:sigma-B regulation protein RsbU (phosphoserine phosphatase)
MSLGPDGRILRVNATFAEWLGAERNELLGRRFADLLSIGGRMFYETHFAPLLRMQGVFEEAALDLALPDGSRMPVIANAREKRDAAGGLVVHVALFKAPQRRRYERDLVEARRTMESSNTELRVRVTEAEAAAELREQFIAVLGHDLRNPLAAIQGGTNLPLREAQTERSAAVIGLIRTSVSRMGALIDNILDLTRARLGGGLPVAIRAQTELRPVLDQVLAEIRSAYPERQIEADFGGLSSRVVAAPQRLGQMLSNLLANAVVHGEPEAPITTHAVVADGWFELSVGNRGEPIPAAAMARLFQPFYRGDVRPSAQGLGLGLYIAGKVAEAHGGTLTVSSEPSETRFTFRMPLGRPPQG